MKAKKISNNKQYDYRYGNSKIDSVTKELIILGQLTNTIQLASPSPTLFVLRYDSLMNLIEQKQMVQKFVNANPKDRLVPNYIFQIPLIKTLSNLKYSYQIDVYKQYGKDFKYTGSYENTFIIDNDELKIESKTYKEFAEVEKFYFTQDKKDLNGKIYEDTAKSVDLFFYKPPVIEVKIAFKLNGNGLPVWMLKKTDQKSKSVLFSMVQPGIKVYEIKSIARIFKDNNPGLIILSEEKYCLYLTKETTNLILELGNW